MGKKEHSILFRWVLSCAAIFLMSLSLFAAPSSGNFLFSQQQNCAACTWHGNMAGLKKITNKQEVKRVSLSKKQAFFRLSLASNQTTGYTWQVVYNKALLKLVNSKYIAPKTDLIGSPGEQQWTFKAVKSALREHHETIVTFNYVRPWEKNAPPAETKTVKVIIN